MTKFRFDIIKSQQLCENIFDKQKLYQSTTDNLYREVINSKNIWFDSASDIFNRRVQNDEASLKDALTSINSYYKNIYDFSNGLSDILSASGVNRGIMDYDTPYITLSKEKFSLVNKYLNNAINSLATHIPSGFDKSYDINEISKNVININNRLIEINDKVKEIEKNVETLISVHRTKERAIEFVKIDSNVTRFNWTVVPVMKKASPKVIRVVTYDRIADTKQVDTNNLNMYESREYTTRGNDVVDTVTKNIENNVYANTYTPNVAEVKTESNSNEMQVASDMSLTIGPVGSVSSQGNMQIASDMSLSLGAVDINTKDTSIQEASSVNISTSSVNSNNTSTDITSSDYNSLNTSKVDSKVNDTNIHKVSDISISNGAINNTSLNVNMQSGVDKSVNTSAVINNSNSVNMVKGTDFSINTNTVENNSIDSSKMQKATSTDTVIDEIKNSNIDIQ